MKFKHFLLSKVRLTHYLVIFFVIFFLVSLFLPKIDLQGSALTLFSVNSFLYGFYISPIINAQRIRIDQMHKLVITEVAKLQEVMQYSRRMEADFQTSIHSLVSGYVAAAAKGGGRVGEKQLDELVELIVTYSGDQKDPHKEMLKSVFAAQQSRAEIKILAERKVYSNEWMVMLILFTITISFILFTKLPDVFMLEAIPAILCAGLSMLIVILVKMSTLTHKKAKTIWQPLQEFAAEAK